MAPRGLQTAAQASACRQEAARGLQVLAAAGLLQRPRWAYLLRAPPGRPALTWRLCRGAGVSWAGRQGVQRWGGSFTELGAVHKYSVPRALRGALIWMTMRECAQRCREPEQLDGGRAAHSVRGPLPPLLDPGGATVC